MWRRLLLAEEAHSPKSAHLLRLRIFVAVDIRLNHKPRKEFAIRALYNSLVLSWQAR